jgi:hypothetical protein
MATTATHRHIHIFLASQRNITSTFRLRQDRFEDLGAANLYDQRACGSLPTKRFLPTDSIAGAFCGEDAS